MERFQGSNKYCEVLCDDLLPFASEVFGEGKSSKFQEENAPMCTSNMTKHWPVHQSISTIQWLPNSPDGNII